MVLAPTNSAALLARLVARVGDHEALLRAREGQHDPMERVARAGERQDVVSGNALDLGHRVDEVVRLLVEVAAALCDHLVDRLDRLGARPHRVLVGVDLDRVGRESGPRREALGQRRLVVERQGRPRGQEGRQAAEVAAGESAAEQVPALLRAEQVLHRSSSIRSSRDGRRTIASPRRSRARYHADEATWPGEEEQTRRVRDGPAWPAGRSILKPAIIIGSDGYPVNRLVSAM